LSLFSFVVFYSSCLFCLTSSSPYHTQDAFNLLL
jgi:predicted membrane channel-forming protein YqfA (hemolysin III family)